MALVVDMACSPVTSFISRDCISACAFQFVEPRRKYFPSAHHSLAAAASAACVSHQIFCRRKLFRGAHAHKAATSRLVALARKRRKLGPHSDVAAQDPYPGVPWVDLPVLDAEKKGKLDALMQAFDEVHGNFVESSTVRDSEYRSIFQPRRCSSTFGELDQSSVARLLQLGTLTESDSFVDVGSGLGKLVVVAAVLTRAKMCYGLELSPSRHQKACEALDRLYDGGYLSLTERQRICLVCADCGDEEKRLPDGILQASHFIITVKRSHLAVNRLRANLAKSGPLLDGRPRVLWSVAFTMAKRAGMKLTGRYVISGFEFPPQVEPGSSAANEVVQTGDSGDFVVYEYTLTV